MIDGCEPPCCCWDLNSGPLEELKVLLTAEPSLQSKATLIKDNISLVLAYSFNKDSIWGLERWLSS